MNFLFNNRKIPSFFFLLFLSPILLSYQHISSLKPAFTLHPHQGDNDQIIQVGLTLANGYSGETSIVITKDSTHFKSYPYQVKSDTTTSQELWKEINDMINMDDISKIPNGKTNKDVDGTDTICYIKTKFKQDYSFTNGYGERFERQKRFVSLLTNVLFQSLLKSLK